MSPRDCLEFFGERFVVDEGPRIVELMIPCPLEILYGHDELLKLFVADKRQKSSIYTIAVRIFGIIVVALYSTQRLRRLMGLCRNDLASAPAVPLGHDLPYHPSLGPGSYHRTCGRLIQVA